jgi:Flp pilus assembly protein TadB
MELKNKKQPFNLLKKGWQKKLRWKRLAKNKKTFSIGAWQIELRRKKAGKKGNSPAIDELVADAKKRINRLNEQITALKKRAASFLTEKAAAFEKQKSELKKRIKEINSINFFSANEKAVWLKKRIMEINYAKFFAKANLKKPELKKAKLFAKPNFKALGLNTPKFSAFEKSKIWKMLSSEASKKSAPEAALAAIFAWFVAALLLDNILLGALYALAAFFAAFVLLLYYPTIKKKNYAKRVDAQLPFVLLNIAIELNLGIDFLRCLQHAAKQRGEAAAEFRKVIIAIERQGATVQDAMLQMAARVNSRMLNRSIVQLVAAFEQGAKQAAGEPIKKIAAEILSRQKIESKLFAGKLVVLSLLFIAVSAIVPALFQSFTIVGSMVLKTQFTAMQVFLIIVVLFPLLDLIVLFYIKSKTPVFLRG